MSDRCSAPRAACRMDGVWVHRLALLTSGMTLVLILIGGMVTHTGSALAVPDWPTTFGYNMFLYPWSKMVGGIFYEHSHRLVGSVVGLLTMTLAILLWIVETRAWLKWLGTVALGAVILQGVLGGLRVVLPSIGGGLAIIHGCLAQAFFALTVSLALFTAREWREPSQMTRPSADAGPLRQVCLLTTAVVSVQIIFGAIVTHAGILFQAHLLLGALVAIHVVALAAWIRRRHPDQPKLVGPASLLCGLLVLQLFLGLGSSVGRFTWLAIPSASLTGLALPIAHRITGALILASCLILTLRARRVLGTPNSAVRQAVVASCRSNLMHRI